MMQEYRVNVYDVKSHYVYGSHIAKEDYDILNYCRWGNKKAIYRIHVKIKNPLIKVTVIGDCGKPHTMNEWRVCRACAAPKPINGIFRRDNWME